MQSLSSQPRVNGRLRWAAAGLCATLALLSRSSLAQAPNANPANAPASTPAGASPPSRVAAKEKKQGETALSAKTLRDADEAFIRGARALDRRDLPEAEREFARAAGLNPQNRDYALALAVTREHRLTELVQRAANAEKAGRTAEAASLLTQAHAIDPDNAVVRQHFGPDGQLLPFTGGAPILPALAQPAPALSEPNPLSLQRAADAATVGPAVAFVPPTGRQSLHARGGAQEILTTLCNGFGLKAQFDASVTGGEPIRLDLESADFNEASRVAQTLTHTFAVPIQPGVLFFAKDTPENRAHFQPLVEETLFIPGVSAESLTEYANMARNVFNLKVVSAVGSAGGLVLRGDGDTLDRVNATFADLIDNGAEVQLDLTLYEVDRSHQRSLGLAPPHSVGAYSVAAEAQSIVNANQSAISAAVSSGALTLTGNTYTDQITEVAFLVGAGLVTVPQFTNLLGTIGRYAGAPLAGVFLGSTTTFYALVNSSEVRLLDKVQLRVSSNQEGSFRAGTRFPIETGIYSSGVSGIPVSGSINGVSIASLLAQYGGGASASVPQIQYEDLGLTLKATPQVLRSDAVAMKLDFKIETLGSGSINSLPILNSRQLSSMATIPAGQTALLASLVSRSELGAIDGLPFLSELPGFQGTEKITNNTSTELLITITPHVIRNRRVEVAGRRMLMPVESTQRGIAPE